MAKKRKKRRHPQRPRPRPQETGAVAEARGTSESEAEAERGPSRRAERKEEARRERERRIRQTRRRRRTRRLIRWASFLAVVGLIAGGVYLAGSEDRELQQKAALAADRIACDEVEEQESELPRAHTEPFAAGEDAGDGVVPAFGGNHSQQLPSEPKVYSQPIPEEQAIHNMEHGYVLLYYAAEGEKALSEDAVGALEDLANDEGEVLMAPYPDLADSIILTAWGARQSCNPPADANPDDVALIARAFIDEWKNGQFAPEAQIP